MGSDNRPKGEAKIGNRIRRRLLTALVAAAMTAILTGCWDRLEIEERAIILGIAIDKAPPGSVRQPFGAVPETNVPPVRVTLQIAVPGRIPLGPSDSGGSSKQGQKPVWVVKAEGSSVDDALNIIQQQVANRLFFGHLRVIVISDEVAKDGLVGINDYLRRNPEIRRTNWMVISDGEAAKLMRVVPQLERVPILYVLSTMDHAVQMGKLPNAFAGVFWSTSSSKGAEPYLPYIRMVESGSFEISGLAYFRNDQLVGTTQPGEIGIFMAIKNMEAGGYAFLTKIPDTETAVMYQVTHRKSRIDVAIRNGKPVISVKIHNEGNLLEKTNEKVQLEMKVVNEIERQLGKQSPPKFRQLIKETQERGADIFGFGEYVRANEPGYWEKEIGTKEKWQEMYKTVEVNLQITYSVRRIGGKTT